MILKNIATIHLYKILELLVIVVLLLLEVQWNNVYLEPQKERLQYIVSKDILSINKSNTNHVFFLFFSHFILLKYFIKYLFLLYLIFVQLVPKVF